MTTLDALCFSSDFLFGETVMRVLAETAQALTLIAETPTGELAGFTIAHCSQQDARDAAYLVTIDVAPTLRRSGIGGRLLRTVERVMRDHAVCRVELHVHTANLDAIEFYERHGYERRARVPQFYGLIGRDAYLYCKELDSVSSAKTSAPQR